MKYYITTSIAYVNAAPHIGYAMELLEADVLARAARQRGDEVIYCTGTDEHGTKVAQKAAEAGKTPKAFADEISTLFTVLLQDINISNDRFVRTTDPEHEKRAALIWKALGEDIYKAKYIGWYDVRQEEFIPEAQADPARMKPDHPQAYQRLEEENYFFRLSKYNDRIREKIESDEFQIIPETRRNEILSVLKEGLEDISISRPKAKLDWGIPVPGDPEQVMYVWVEALMNYLTVLGYPDGADFRAFWPANVQVVGKDITRFHAAIWPAMLMSLGLPLAKQLYVHSFITVEGEKMSKSLGNVISPKDVVDKYGVDAFRYYFLRHIPSYNDGDFSWDTFDAAYNNELANELGNAVQRTAAMIQKYQNGLIGTIPAAEHDRKEVDDALIECRFDRALDRIWDQVRGLNQYIDEEKPWEIAKNPEDKDHLAEVLAYQAGCLLEIADLLTPFLPETAAKIKAVFETGQVKPIAGTLFPKHDVAAEQHA
ncbi:MAG TPA: class I tRNA ligase family protein [Candidatus Saccharimonadales bacterium]|nr:class I tRNA ligase family protein [Candidatus Saccharimonadales bacterium]